MVPARDHGTLAAPPPLSGARRLADLRIPLAGVLALLGGVGSAILILRVTRTYIFWYDEWDFVQGAAHWSTGDFFAGHAEHWSTVPRVAYWVLLRVVGAGHYLPFMAVLMVLHVASGFMLFVLLRRRAGDLVGLAGAALLLLLGRGWEDLLWAFQIGFYSSVAFGLLAVLLLDRAPVSRLRGGAAAIALVVSLAASGVGLFFLAAVAVELLADRERRAALLALIPPVLAYGAWYLTVGRQASHFYRSPFTLSALASVPQYAPHGLGAAVAGLVSLDATRADLGLAALAVVVTWLGARHGLSPRALGALAGLVVMFLILSLVRGQFGLVEAESPRYTHIASVFLLLLLGEAAAFLPGRGLWPVLVVAATALVLLGNTQQLLTAAHARRDVLAQTAQEIATVNAVRDRPDLRRDVFFDPARLPQTTVGDLLTTEARFGDVVPPAADPDPAVLQRVLVSGR